MGRRRRGTGAGAGRARRSTGSARRGRRRPGRRAGRRAARGRHRDQSAAPRCTRSYTGRTTGRRTRGADASHPRPGRDGGVAVDLALTPEHEALRSTVRKWVDDVVVPDALRNDREERFPVEALAGLRSTGFIGLTIPESYGGSGADPLSYVLMIEELGRGDANVRSIVSVHLGLVGGSIARWGTDEQKAQWLPRMATGEVLSCFGLTEPDHGSDPANLRATAERTAAGWRITGRKLFITNGSIAGVALVMARSGGAGPRGI